MGRGLTAAGAPAKATGEQGLLPWGPGWGSGPQPHRLHDRRPSCLTRGGGRARATGELVLIIHTDGFSFSESLTLQQNFCSRKVLCICTLKENLNRGEVHIRKETNPASKGVPRTGVARVSHSAPDAPPRAQAACTPRGQSPLTMTASGSAAWGASRPPARAVSLSGHGCHLLPQPRRWSNPSHWRHRKPCLFQRGKERKR